MAGAIRGLGLLWLAMSFVYSAHASDLDDAQAVVDSIREADLPQASTDTKREPTGDPVSDYKPDGPGLDIEEPPSPVDRNNPQNDPDVQAGFDAHQAWYNGKE